MPGVFDLLISLREISHHIQDLRIYESNRNDKNYVESIIQLIKSQHKLSFVLLNKIGSDFTLILETLSSIHSNSLTTLILIQIPKDVSLSSIQRFENLQNLSLFNCDNLVPTIFDDLTEIHFDLKSLELDRMKSKVLKSILKLPKENLKKFSFYFNTQIEVIQNFFLKCSKISNLKVKGNPSKEERLNFFSSLSMLENSLTHLSIYFNSSGLHHIFDELSKISLPKLKFLNIGMPKSTNILENYLKMTSSSLQTIILHDSSKFSREYVNILLKYFKRKKTLKMVGISLKSDDKKFKEFVKITKGYFQIVNLWDMDLNNYW